MRKKKEVIMQYYYGISFFCFLIASLCSVYSADKRSILEEETFQLTSSSSSIESRSLAPHAIENDNQQQNDVQIGLNVVTPDLVNNLSAVIQSIHEGNQSGVQSGLNQLGTGAVQGGVLTGLVNVSVQVLLVVR